MREVFKRATRGYLCVELKAKLSSAKLSPLYVVVNS